MTAKYVIDTRNWPSGTLIQLLAGTDMRDVRFVSDNRCAMIRLLDDPAWRESLKVAETPVEAEYAGVRERLEAMRPAPAGFYSARTGYEGEYRQFFGFRS